MITNERLDELDALRDDADAKQSWHDEISCHRSEHPDSDPGVTAREADRAIDAFEEAAWDAVPELTAALRDMTKLAREGWDIAEQASAAVSVLWPKGEYRQYRKEMIRPDVAELLKEEVTG